MPRSPTWLAWEDQKSGGCVLGYQQPGTLAAVDWSLGRRLYNLGEWWHLLSLDAPTVAALWAWFFARAMHLHLPLLQAVLLGVGTWVIYILDRVLDGLRSAQFEPLHLRHHFHARHRTAFLTMASLLFILLAWSVLTRMRPAAVRCDAWIGSCVLLYFCLVHRTVRPHRGLPKELAVAVLFAAATAVPAWVRLGSDGWLSKEQLAPAIVFFAVLCWINCVGIHKWEASGTPHPTTRWAMRHLRPIATMIALFGLVAALLAPSRGLMAVYLAGLCSSGLFFLIDARSTHVSPLHLRIAADAALLTPLALFPLAR